MTLSDRLRALLDRKGYSLADAADVAGMSRQQVHSIVSGKVPNPGILTVKRLVEAVGGTMGEVFPEDD